MRQPAVPSIFGMAEQSLGLRTIARTLNAEGVRSPRARPGRHHSWAPSSVRAILFNPLYKGAVVWGRTKKRDAWGARFARAGAVADADAWWVGELHGAAPWRWCERPHRVLATPTVPGLRGRLGAGLRVPVTLAALLMLVLTLRPQRRLRSTG
jgi:hypothetical protein